MAGERALPDLVSRVRLDTTELDAGAKTLRGGGQSMEAALAGTNRELAKFDALASKGAASASQLAKAQASPLDSFLGPKTSSVGLMSHKELSNFTSYQGVVPGKGRYPSDMADMDADLEKGHYADLYSSSEFKGKVKAMQEYDSALQKHLAPVNAARAAEEAGSDVVKKSSGHLAELTGHSSRAASGVERLGQQFGRLGAQSAGMSRLGSFLSPLTSFGPAGAALIGGAAVAGVGLVLDQAVKKQGEYATSVLKSAAATGLNTTQTQVYGRLLVDIGLKQDDLDRFIGSFNKNLAMGAPLLREHNSSLAAMRITSKDTGEALLQTADYFQKETDGAKKAALANSLFGEGGQALVPVLSQGREFLNGYTAELERYGVILNHSQIETAAFQDKARAQFDLARQGIEAQFIAPLQTGFALLYMTITKSLGDGATVATKFGEVVANVVSYIAGFLGALLGVEVTLADVNDVQTSYTEKAKSLAGATQNASNATAQSTNISKLQAQAIKDRIQTEQDLMKATDRRLDGEQALLEAQDKELDKELALIDANRKSSDLQRKIGQDRAAAAKGVFSGDFSAVQKAGENLTSDLEQQADDQKKAAINAQKAEVKSRLDAIATERKADQQASQDRLDSLNRQQSAAQESSQNELASHNAMLAGVSASYPAATAGFAGFTGGLSTKWSQMGGDMAMQFDAFLWGSKAQGGQKVGGIIPMIQDGQLPGVFKKVGQSLGKALIDGMQSGAGDWLKDVLTHDFSKGWAGSASYITGNAAGGRPPLGRPSWIGEEGPELWIPDTAGTIIPHGQSMAMAQAGAGGGGTVVHQTYHLHPGGLVDKTELRQLFREFMGEMHR